MNEEERRRFGIIRSVKRECPLPKEPKKMGLWEGAVAVVAALWWLLVLWGMLR